jgi:hypothetical protein
VKTILDASTEKKYHFAKCHEACRKDVDWEFGMLQQRFAIVRYPALTCSESQMWECMSCCVIMHNMIIESECDEPVVDDEPFDHESPLAQLNQVSAEFAVFLAMHQEICNKDKHNRLQEDLVEHLYFLFQLMYE